MITNCFRRFRGNRARNQRQGSGQHTRDLPIDSHYSTKSFYNKYLLNTYKEGAVLGAGELMMDTELIQ